jgi:peptidoglycan/LPS O-acetylase OafA/YrhL
LLAAGGVAGHSGWITVLTYPLAALASVAILYGVVGQPWGRRFRLPAYLGKISFGLYVFHAAIIELTGPFLALPFTIAAASLSYHFLETPFLRYKQRFSSKTVSIPTLQTLPRI